MNRTLILVRHGRAERAQAGMPDEARSLTPEGQAALTAPNGFPRTFSLLTQDEREQAVVWASPALRAQQTAQAVASTLGERPIKPLPCLFEQDRDAFLDELSACKETCIVAVGHIPFMERVTEYLCGAQLDFTPGAVACIRLDDALDACESDLLWFVQGPRS